MLFDHKNDTYEQFIDKLNNAEFSIYSKVAGYRVVIVYYSSLEDEDITQCQDDAEVVFSNMASFYLKDKISINEGYFKKYLEK